MFLLQTLHHTEKNPTSLRCPRKPYVTWPWLYQPFWFRSDRQEATPLTSSPCRKHMTLKATYRWQQPDVVPINDKRSCLLPERWIRSDSPKPKPTLFLTVREKKISNLETGWRVPIYYFNVMLQRCETCPPKIMSSFFRVMYTLSDLLFSTD